MTSTSSVPSTLRSRGAALGLLFFLCACGGGSVSQSPAAAGASTSTAEATAAPALPAATLHSTVSPLASGVNPPVILNASGSVRAGQVIGLQGENFGSAPAVFLDTAPTTPLEIVDSVPSGWLAVRLPSTATGALQVRMANGTGVSALVKLNAALPLHLDALELTPGGAVRVFGRNLMLPGYTPKLVINGVAAPLDLVHSSEHLLVASVPATLVASRAAVVTVDNGNGTGPATLDRTVTVLRSATTDPFGLNVSWAAAFGAIATHVVNAATDPRLGTKAQCDGTHDDAYAVQSALDLAAADGGGIVQLPAGTCRLAYNLNLRSRVVLQGMGKALTQLAYAANYPLAGANLDLFGVRNLTLANAGSAVEGPLLKDSTHLVLQNVAFNVGTSRQMYLTGNRQVAIEGSDFVQGGSIDQQGPYTLYGSAGLVFEGNSTRWVNGAPAFGLVHDSVIDGNHFTRDASVQTDAGFVHSMTLDFSYRVAVLGNTFDVAGGPITNKLRNDGETMLVEGGSAARTENLGRVAGATAMTLSDPANSLVVDPFATGTIPENYGVAIVAGRGAGQTRRVMAYAAPTLTIDRAWDIIPDATSSYATFVWGLEKSLIENNVLAQNPRGIWLSAARCARSKWWATPSAKAVACSCARRRSWRPNASTSSTTSWSPATTSPTRAGSGCRTSTRSSSTPTPWPSASPRSASSCATTRWSPMCRTWVPRSKTTPTSKA